MEIKKNISLKPNNTFGIDVTAQSFTEAFTRQDILDYITTHLPSLPKPLLILGGGSNILFTKDFLGSILKISTKGIRTTDENDDFVFVRAEAGENWEMFVNYCVDQNWGGLENLAFIPGNIGSCPIQNIGAYGTEIKNCLFQLEALDLKSHETKIFQNEDCKFGYRSSVFKKEMKGEFIILSVTFRLSKKPIINTAYGAIQSELDIAGIKNPSIKDIAEAVTRIRRSKLPDPKELGNAGSFFKNPTVTTFEYYRLKNEFPDIIAYNQNDGSYKLAAGWLIEKCGLKGYRKGDAGVHEKQALILVNYGRASGQDILSLAQEVISSVRSKFGIELESEVNII
jgi:UDP-N-acetylmuramate dehydrogenase